MEMVLDVYKRSFEPLYPIVCMDEYPKQLISEDKNPNPGSWLNIAEIESNVLWGQCLKRRIDDIETGRKEVMAWQNTRNNKNAKVNWRFTTADARVKLSCLYATLNG